MTCFFYYDKRKIKKIYFKIKVDQYNENIQWYSSIPG